MQCFSCGHKNTGGAIHCLKCGLKLDLNADEIQQYYAQKVRDEKKTAAEFHARRLLLFSIVFLVIATTFMVMAGGVAKESSYIPSAALNSEFVKVPYDVRPVIKPLFIPEEAKR